MTEEFKKALEIDITELLGGISNMHRLVFTKSNSRLQNFELKLFPFQ